MKNQRDHQKGELSKEQLQASFFKKQIDEDDCWTLFTNQILLNYKYVFPYQKIFQYIEKYQKYKLRAALSSIPISIQSFQAFYNSIINKALEKEKTYLIKGVSMIADLLNMVNFVKLQQIRMYSSAIEGFRLTCFEKDLDPYGFNMIQMALDIQKVTKYLGDAELMKDKQQIQKIKRQVNELIQNLKKKEKDVMDSMNNCQVKQPYIAQNKQLQTINSQKLFQSYIKSINIKNKVLSDTLTRKYFQIHKKITQFGYNCKQYNLKCQKNARNIIQTYNNTISQPETIKAKNNKNLISKALFSIKNKHYIDANDINVTWMSREQARPCLLNKDEHIWINSLAHFFDLQKKQDIWVQLNFRQDLSRQKNNSLFQIQIDKDCNPYNYIQEKKQKHFFDSTHPRFRNQMKRQLIGYKYNNQKHNSLRKVIKLNRPEIKFQSNQSSKLFRYLIENVGKQQKYIWANPKQRQQTKLSSIYIVNKAAIKIKGEQNLEQILQMEQIYQSKRDQQQKKRLLKLKKLITDRTYKMFAQLNVHPKTKKQLFSQHRISNQSQIQRYGIIINTDIKQNSFQDLNKFLFYYFKERYFKQNQKVKQNKDIPIFMSLQNRQNFLSETVLKRILSLVSKYPFFILWSNDLIIYQQKKMFQDIITNFHVVGFQSELQCHQIMYQLRKRLIKTKTEITQTIDTKFIVQKNKNNQKRTDHHLEEIFSKVQTVKRILYDSHQQPIDGRSSIEKGKQIVQKIIQGLIQNDN